MIRAMATTTAKAKKAAPPAKKAAPRKPAASKAAPPAPVAPVVETSAEPDGPKPVTITFKGHVLPVLRPNEAQLALLIDASQWMNRARQQLRKLGDIPAGAGDDHPLVQEAIKHAERGLQHVGRLQRIIGSLFENEGDWDWICEMMAERKLPWQEVADLPEAIINAHNDADRMMPDNREARRAAAGRGKRVA
jgi:hypothetical protein